MTWDIAKSDFGPIDALLELCPIAVVVIGLSPLEPIYLNTVAQQLFDVYSNVSISKSAFGQWELQNTNWFELEESIRVGGQKLTRLVHFKNGEGRTLSLEVTSHFNAGSGRPHLVSYLRQVSQLSDAKEPWPGQQPDLEQVYRLAQIGHWRWDFAKNTVELSLEFCRLTGQTPHNLEPNFESQRKHFTDKSFDRLSESIDRCNETSNAYEIILELRRPVHERQWMLARGKSILDENGILIAHLGTIQNITNQIRTQSDLEQDAIKSRDLSDQAIAFLQSASDGFHILSADGHLVEASDTFCEMLGFGKDELIGQHVSFWDANFKQDEFQGVIDGQIKSQAISHFVTLHRRKDGSVFDAEITGRAVRLKDRTLLFNSSRNITQRMANKVQLQLAATLFEAANEGILITDDQNRIQQINAAFERLFEYAPHEIIGMTTNVLGSGLHRADFYDRMVQTIAREDRWAGEIWNRTKSGKAVPHWLSITAIRTADGKLTNYVAFFTDIAERKATEERIYKLAFLDPLTELPNRRLMLEHIESGMVHCLQSGYLMAVLFIDLDYFKNVNDQYGHYIGDQLLIHVSGKIRHSLRSSDLVGRLGGDEFLVILQDISDTDFPAVVAETILSSISAPAFIDEKEIAISASIGIVLVPADATKSEEVVRFADIAMYEAKRNGRNRIQYFSQGINRKIQRRIELSTDLNRASIQSEFHIVWQPQIELATGRLAGMEALLRWSTPMGDKVSPVEFIPLLEESGKIIKVGAWVLGQVCKKIREWRNLGLRPPCVAINVSTVQLEQENFNDIVRSHLRANNLEPEAIAIEITESVLMRAVDEGGCSIKNLTELKSEIAIDDFGTGYSSLAYLANFPIAKLKIDRAFVKDIARRHQDRTIVGAVTSMAKQLSMSVVAEGIETARQLRILSDLGVDIGQGYFWSKPTDESDIIDWLKTGHTFATPHREDLFAPKLVSGAGLTIIGK